MTSQRVRTEYILSNLLVNLNNVQIFMNGWFPRSFPIKITLPALNANEEKIFQHALSVCKKIYQTYEWKINQMTQGLQYVRENRIEQFLSSLHDRLFADHTSWTRIALFICIVSSFIEPFVSNEKLHSYFFEFAEKKLSPWIEGHGGWEAIDVDEPPTKIPYINLRHVFLQRRSNRLSSKEKLRYFEFY